MASALEPEIQLAQKLASNERPIRTRAIKKLRKYIILRSQKETGRFTGDELLKLWKGLFYCLWMQDKPLLQEELSNQIAKLIHSFHYTDGQFLYLESSLQTFKREWTNIDRLRMDKFYQLVRFMFRQTFEMLKRKNWESSLVSRFLELLMAQVLQSGSAAPNGLQFHILDIYLTELALVGSAELTADQNLMLIGPFCKIAAKTKDQTLFSAICNNIFSTIIDQAPFAIEELIKEVKAAEDSDSGQASDEDCEDQIKERKPIPLRKKQTGNELNDNKSPEDGEGDEDEDEDELHLKDKDTEFPCDGDVGPVLQFDYSALADKLFQFAKRSSTPSKNRKRLYKITKVLRNLNEGNFPQDDYTEEVSTDEDDDMFGSRKRIKRSICHVEQDEEGPPVTKSKGKKKKAPTLNKQNQHTEKDDSEQVDVPATNGKKKKLKKKARNGASAVCSKPAEAVDQELSAKAEVTSESCQATCEETVTTTTTQECVSAVHMKKKKGRKAKRKPEGSEDEQKIHGVSLESDLTLIHCDDSAADDTICLKKQTNSSTPAKKNKNKSLDTDAQVELERNPTAITSEASQTTTAVPIKKKTKKRNRKKLQQTLAASPVADDSAVTLLKCERSQKELETAINEKQGAVDAAQVVNTEKLPLQIPVTPPAKKKKTSKLAPFQAEGINDESPRQTVSSLKTEFPVNECEAPSSSGKLTKKKKRKIPVVFEFEADELEASAQKESLIKDLSTEETASKKTKLGNDAEKSATPVSIKKSASRLASDFITFQSNTVVPTPLFCKTKTSPKTPLSSKKKSKSPKSESKKVTFGLRNNKTAEFRKTDRSLLVSPDGSSRVPFDPEQKPKFGVLKSPPTPVSTLKISPHPKRKTSLKSLKCTPKRRPLAADFF